LPEQFGSAQSATKKSKLKLKHTVVLLKLVNLQSSFFRLREKKSQKNTEKLRKKLKMIFEECGF
jgi:hypothetical protein